MGIDQSMQTRRINYMNRPFNDPITKRPLAQQTFGQTDKSQRNFHVTTEDEQQYLENAEQYVSEVEHSEAQDYKNEPLESDFVDLNFLE